MTGYYRIRNLKKDYNPQDSSSLAAIDIDQLDIDLGGIIAIVGSSGSGKTTFLNLISGLEAFDQNTNTPTILDLKLPGGSQVHHLAATASGTGGSADFPHDHVSYIFQQGYLLNQASIGINLAMTRRAAGLKADAQSLEKLLAMAKLNDEDPGSKRHSKTLQDRTITLSGGQQQRINIARALGREPELLFADELSSSLDPHRARLVLTELRNWFWQGQYSVGGDRKELQRTMLWVTHDYALACEFADAIIVLHEGKLAEHGERPVELNAHAKALSSSELLQWVNAGCIAENYRLCAEGREIPGLSTHAENTASDNMPVPQAPSQRISATQQIIGNLGSGVALSWLEAFPLTRSSASGAVNFARSVLRPVLGFSHWVRALQLAAVIALIMIITFGRDVVIRYFDAQLNDPSLRHVIVQQNTKELQRSIIDDTSLNELSASIANQSSDTAQVERSAFGRFTEYVDAYPQGLDQTNPGFIAEITIGVLDRSEPVYNSLNVYPLDAAKPGCNKATALSPQALIPYADELALIVSQNYIDEVKKIYDVDLCANPFLDLWDAGAPRTFRVVGFIESPPADGYDRFDAIMQIGVWRNWVSLVGKSAIESFSRASVYFTQSNHADVIDKLYARAFAFDSEIVNKFERLIGTSAKLRNTFSIINWLTLVVAATIAAGLTWSYLAQNSKSIAVLRAHAAWVWPLVSAIPFQLLLTFIYSLVYIAIAIGLWNVLVSVPFFIRQVAEFSNGTWVPSRLSWEMIEVTMPWVFGSLLAMLVVGWICLAVWRFTHRSLAHDLRQAY